MYNDLAQTMYAAPQQPIAPIAAPAPVAPTAPNQFLHNLGKVLQDQHAAQSAQSTNQGDSNPYAINWSPSASGNFAQLGSKLMGKKAAAPAPAGGSNA